MGRHLDGWQGRARRQHPSSHVGQRGQHGLLLGKQPARFVERLLEGRRRGRTGSDLGGHELPATNVASGAFRRSVPCATTRASCNTRSASSSESVTPRADPYACTQSIPSLWLSNLSAWFG